MRRMAESELQIMSGRKGKKKKETKNGRWIWDRWNNDKKGTETEKI